MSKLDKASNNYIHSWEGLSSTKGDKYKRLKVEIENVTIPEILTLYNINCVDKSWNQPLSELFSQELLERIKSDATFSISTVWRSTKEWLEFPYMTVQLGFDEVYDILDAENEPILEDDPVAMTFTLVNDEFPDDVQRSLIHKFLIDTVVHVTIQVEKDNIYATKISDISLAKTKIVQSMRLVQIANSEEITIPLRIYHTPDLHLLYLMMNNIEEKTYEIIDLYGHYEKELAIQEHFDFNELQVEVVSLPPVEELLAKMNSRENLPLLWKKIHLTAFKCTDLDKFSEWIWELVKNLPCDCKWHALHYIQRNPPNNLVPTSSDVDINIAFYWSWLFHNDVNQRLGKDEYPYEAALEYYSELI